MSTRGDDQLIPLLASIDESLSSIAQSLARACAYDGPLEQLTVVAGVLRDLKAEMNDVGRSLWGPLNEIAEAMPKVSE